MIAVVLSPKARALIRANREPRLPTAADRERVAAALRAQLGTTVLPLDTPGNITMMTSGAQRRFATAFGLCVVGAVLFLARRPAPSLKSAMRSSEKSVASVPSALPTMPVNPASASLETPATLQPETSHVPQRAERKVAPSSAAQDTLAQELALLTSAASQLSSGQASAALLALDEHQRRFSHGVLSDERKTAKARALCMLHRFDEGRAALARLAAGSPALARAKEECDSAWARAQMADSTLAREAN